MFWFFSTILYKNFSVYEWLNVILSQMYIILHVKYPLLLSDFNETSNFWADFLKISNSMKIRRVWGELFHMEGRTDKETDMIRLIVVPRNCAMGPRNKEINETENALRTVHPSLNRTELERGECAKCYQNIFFLNCFARNIWIQFGEVLLEQAIWYTYHALIYIRLIFNSNMIFSVELRHFSTNRSEKTLKEPAGILAEIFFPLLLFTRAVQHGHADCRSRWFGCLETHNWFRCK